MKAILAFGLTLALAGATAGWAQEPTEGQAKRKRSDQGDASKANPSQDSEKQDAEKGKKKRERQRRAGQANPQARGGNPQQRLEMLMKRMDSDGDGLVSREEAPERLGERFAQLDKNNDGNLDAEELKRMAGRQGRPGASGGLGGPGGMERTFDPAQLFQRMDKDQNGTLGKDELPERMQQRFAELDLDGNGELDRDELAKMQEMMGQRRPGGEGDRKETDPNQPVKPKRPTRGGGDA